MMAEVDVSHETDDGAVDGPRELLPLGKLPSFRENLAKQDSFSDYDKKHGEDVCAGDDVAAALVAAVAPPPAERVLEEAFSYRSLMSKRPPRSAADMHTPTTKGFQHLVHKMQAQRTAQRKLLQSLSPGAAAAAVTATDEACGGALSGPETHAPANSDISISGGPGGNVPDAPVSGYSGGPESGLGSELDTPARMRQAVRAHQLVEKMDRLRADAKSRRNLAVAAKTNDNASTSANANANAAVPDAVTTVLPLPSRPEATSAPVAEPGMALSCARTDAAVTSHAPGRGRSDAKPPTTSAAATSSTKSQIPRRVKTAKRPASGGGVSNYSRIGFSSGGGGDSGSSSGDVSKYAVDAASVRARSSSEQRAPESVEDPEERPLRPLGMSLESLLAAAEGDAGGEAGGDAAVAAPAGNRPVSVATDAAPSAVVAAPATAASPPPGVHVVAPCGVEVADPQGCGCVVS